MSSNGNIVPGLYLGNGNQITFNGNFNCDNNLAHRYEGIVKSVGNNAIKISTSSGETVIGAISPCTVAQATSPNYNIQSGDTIAFYGSSVSDGIFNISSLNCHWFWYLLPLFYYILLSKFYNLSMSSTQQFNEEEFINQCAKGNVQIAEGKIKKDGVDVNCKEKESKKFLM